MANVLSQPTFPDDRRTGLVAAGHADAARDATGLQAARLVFKTYAIEAQTRSP
jgi:hypothetical protein